MNFTQYDLGNRSRGEIVEVMLSGSAANVRLMDPNNFSSYRSGRSHRYIGGLVKRSPYHVRIPHAGHWYLTVDMQGLRGTVRSSARVLSGPLPAAQETPLASIPSLVRHGGGDLPPASSADRSDLYDVFISHASEDKDELVRPLALALQAEGLIVWYDEFELRIGDSLRQKIDRGLVKSHFGVVVLSKDFFRKGWTNYELDGLVTKGLGGEQVILPIWHNITKAQLIEYSPSLADKVARSTATHTIEEIADEIASLIRDTR